MTIPARTLTPGPSPGVLRDRTRRWVKIFSAYFTAQTLTQFLGIAAGLLFVNLMPLREFALYTLGASVLTFFTFLSDMGTTSSLVYFFHRSRGDEGELRRYIAAVLSLRKVAFLLGSAVVLVAFPYVSAGRGFGLRESLLVTGGIVLSVWFQVSSSVRVLALRLMDRYGQSYRAEVSGAGLRLALALALVVAGALRAWAGVLTTAIGTGLTAFLARPAQPVRVEEDLVPYRRDVLRYLLPSLPSALYFSLQGPLTVWLAATFGSTRNIAEVGALGRLGLVVGIFSGLTGVVFMPRLARITDERVYWQRFLQFGALLLGVMAAMLLAAAVAPGLFLMLLGKQYSGLHRELLLTIGSSGFMLLSGYCVSVNLARSWNRLEGLAVVLLIAAQAVLMAVLPLSKTSGVLAFNLLTGAVGLVLQLLITLAGRTRPRWVQWMR